jgi:hypothetical protein
VNLPAEYIAVLGTRSLVKDGFPVDTPSWLEKLLDLLFFCGDCFYKFLFTALFFAVSYEFPVTTSYRWFPVIRGFFMIWDAFHTPALLVPLVSVFLSTLWIWIYIFVLRHKTEIYRLALAVKWTRSRSDEELGAKVRTSFVASDRTYGARRVWKDMLAEGLSCGLHRIERLMRLQALKARPRRRRLPPDLGERQATAVAPNVLDRSFDASAPVTSTTIRFQSS